MEKPKTQAEIRHQNFIEAGALAKAIGDVAMEDIDPVLADNELVMGRIAHSALFWVWLNDEKIHPRD